MKISAMAVKSPLISVSIAGLMLVATGASGIAMAQQPTGSVQEGRFTELEARVAKLETQLTNLTQLVEAMDSRVQREIMASKPWYETLDPSWRQKYWQDRYLGGN